MGWEEKPPNYGHHEKSPFPRGKVCCPIKNLPKAGLLMVKGTPRGKLVRFFVVPRWVWRLGVRGQRPCQYSMGLARKYPAQRAEPPTAPLRLFEAGCEPGPQTAATAHRKGWRKGHRSVATLHRERQGQGSCSGPDRARAWRWEQNQWPQRLCHGPEPGTKAHGLQRRPKDQGSLERWWRQKQPSLRWLPPWDGKTRAAMRPSRTPGGQ